MQGYLGFFSLGTHSATQDGMPNSAGTDHGISITS